MCSFTRKIIPEILNQTIFLHSMSSNYIRHYTGCFTSREFFYNSYTVTDTKKVYINYCRNMIG